MVEIQDEQQPDETVQEAAEHADLADAHRQEMQRRAVQAEAAEPSEAAELEREADDHRAGAVSEERRADELAHDADAQAGEQKSA